LTFERVPDLNEIVECFQVSVPSLFTHSTMAALTFPIMMAALAGRVSIPASDPNMQYIGRMVSAADGTVQFDMPGCEIRTVMTLTSGTSCRIDNLTCSEASDGHMHAWSPMQCVHAVLVQPVGHVRVSPLRADYAWCCPPSPSATRATEISLASVAIECGGVTCACSNVRMCVPLTENCTHAVRHSIILRHTSHDATLSRHFATKSAHLLLYFIRIFDLDLYRPWGLTPMTLTSVHPSVHQRAHNQVVIIFEN
jgi:hypothetical protein